MTGFVVERRVHPALVLWVPLFHSLQYLAVVWRYEANRNRALRPHDLLPELRLAGFYAIGLGLGYLGFWLLPRYLNRHAPYDQALFGTGLFFFVFWIFINLHHYFLGHGDVAQGQSGCAALSVRACAAGFAPVAVLQASCTIWLRIARIRANCGSPTRFIGCARPPRMRQSKDLGW